jgi:hypothetical protein
MSLVLSLPCLYSVAVCGDVCIVVFPLYIYLATHCSCRYCFTCLEFKVFLFAFLKMSWGPGFDANLSLSFKPPSSGDKIWRIQLIVLVKKRHGLGAMAFASPARTECWWWQVAEITV